MNFFEAFFSAVLPIVSVRFVVWLGFKITEKQELKSLKTEDIIVKSPYIQEIIGLLCVLFGISFIIMSDYGILLGRTIITDLVLMVFPILFGVFFAALAIAFKIVMLKDCDYFTYRSLYIRKRKIFYDDIDYCEKSNNGICVLVKGKKYFVSSFNTNFCLFERELGARHIKMKT